MNNFEFTTINLGFRLITKNDLAFFDKLYADPEVTQYLVSSQQAHLDKVVTNIANGIPCFLLFDLTTNEFVGRAGFHKCETGEIEVGYVLQKKFWGQGLATEALTALFDWARANIASEYLIAYTPIEHHASQRVMQKCGMEHYKDDLDKSRAECRFYRIKIK